MMKYTTAVLALSIFALSGCGKLSDEELWKKVESSKKNGNIDSTIAVCRIILQEHPEGIFAPAALYMIAECYHSGLHESRTALTYYREFIRRYPDRKQTPVAQFILGFIYNNELGIRDSAQIEYQKFVDAYPNHELAPSARFELQTLGKQPEEILKPMTRRNEKMPSVKKK